jgi:hypothetical protein
MANKSFKLEGIGDVTLYKRKGARSVRLTVAHDGALRLTLPIWMPYKLGLQFLREKRAWVEANRRPAALLLPGARIGKAHSLEYQTATSIARPKVRVGGNRVVVSLPPGVEPETNPAQLAAKRGATRALKIEAKALLPKRLASLAEQNGFTFKDLQIKQLKTRWGSCNQDHVITLNLYLMQLPWQLIDYVLLHELVHTRVMAHGRPFWDELDKYVTNLPGIRKTMRKQRPHLQTQ